MKIIFLNIWGGKIYEPLMKFLRQAAGDTDFFCLQEVFDSPEQRLTSWGGYANIYASLCNALPDFTPHYAIAMKNFDGDHATNFPLSYGIAIFAKKNIAVLSRGDILISGESWRGPGTAPIFPHTLHYVRFENNGVAYTLAHLHGAAVPGSKQDTPERIAQSQKIADFLNAEQGAKILGGDFNLMPDTESIRMIERAGMPPHQNIGGGGMRNLITEYGITSTRSPLSYGQYPEYDRQYFADYTFVSPGVRVARFTVPAVEVSDHLPLILECG